MRPDLLLPLDCLPGPVPVGAPVSAVRGIDGERRTGVATEWHPRNGLRVAWPDGAVYYLCSEDAGALDLSRPPVDADGYPTRVDGADVAAGMLARAYRMDLRQLGLGVTWRHVAPGLWELSVCGWGLVFGVDGRASVIVPALADIDPTDPDADRLALAAVILAAPWRK